MNGKRRSTGKLRKRRLRDRISGLCRNHPGRHVKEVASMGKHGGKPADDKNTSKGGGKHEGNGGTGTSVPKK